MESQNKTFPNLQIKIAEFHRPLTIKKTRTIQPYTRPLGAGGVRVLQHPLEFFMNPQNDCKLCWKGSNFEDFFPLVSGWAAPLQHPRLEVGPPLFFFACQHPQSRNRCHSPALKNSHSCSCLICLDWDRRHWWQWRAWDETVSLTRRAAARSHVIRSPQTSSSMEQM